MKNIAEEIRTLYDKYPAGLVNSTVDAWAVKKVVVVHGGTEEDDPLFVFEDESAIRKGERIVTRSKTFAGDLPVWIRPYARMNALFDIADLSKINPEFAKGFRAMLDREGV